MSFLVKAWTRDPSSSAGYCTVLDSRTPEAFFAESFFLPISMKGKIPVFSPNSPLCITVYKFKCKGGVMRVDPWITDDTGDGVSYAIIRCCKVFRIEFNNRVDKKLPSMDIRNIVDRFERVCSISSNVKRDSP